MVQNGSKGHHGTDFTDIICSHHLLLYRKPYLGLQKRRPHGILEQQMELGRHHDCDVIYICVGTVPIAKVCTCCKDATQGKSNTILFHYLEVQPLNDSII